MDVLSQIQTLSREGRRKTVRRGLQEEERHRAAQAPDPKGETL
jgi:hypothetical protein